MQTTPTWTAGSFNASFDVNRARLDTNLPSVVLDRIGRGKPIAEMF